MRQLIVRLAHEGSKATMTDPMSELGRILNDMIEEMIQNLIDRLVLIAKQELSRLLELCTLLVSWMLINLRR